jgi:hypothetical protein
MTARIALAALLLATGGCHTVRPLWEPEEFLARSKPPLVYVVQRDHPVTLALAHPRLTGDTLRGTDGSGRPVALPWDDVLDVYARRLHGGRTVFVVTSITLVSATAVYAFVQKANGNVYTPCEFLPSSHQHDQDGECLTP